MPSLSTYPRETRYRLVDQSINNGYKKRLSKVVSLSNRKRRDRFCSIKCGRDDLPLFHLLVIGAKSDLAVDSGADSAYLEGADVATGADENHGVALFGEVGNHFVHNRLQVAARGGVPVASFDRGFDFVGEAVDLGFVGSGGVADGGGLLGLELVF